MLEYVDDVNLQERQIKQNLKGVPSSGDSILQM